MAQLLEFKTYRRLKRRDWLKLNQRRLQEFITPFLKQHYHTSLPQLFPSTSSYSQDELDQAWDYIDIRDNLQENLELGIAELYSQLKLQWWFDPRLMSREELAEQCLHLYINYSLNQEQVSV